MSYKKNMSKHKKTRESEGNDSFPKVFKSVLIGVGAALLCGAILLFLSAFLCARSEDPRKIMLPLGLATLYLSSLLGGIVAVRHHGSSALLCGALCGLLMILLVWLLGLCFGNSSAERSLPLALLLRLLCILVAIFGAFLGLKRTVKHPHQRH